TPRSGAGATGGVRAEEHVENVVDAAESRPAEVETGRALGAGMAEGVIALPLRLVAQDLVGFVDLLEAGFGLWITVVTVGMVLEGQVPVGTLEILGAGTACDAEHLVIVPLDRHESLGLYRARVGNLYQGRPKHPVVQPVAALNLRDDGTFLVFVRLLAGDGFVLGRVELLTNGWNRRQALRLEGLLELASHQLDALEPVSVDSFRGVVERPLEVVQDRKQLAEQLLVRVLGPIRELLSGAALVILEVRGEPLILRKGRLDFIAGGLQ